MADQANPMTGLLCLIGLEAMPEKVSAGLGRPIQLCQYDSTRKALFEKTPEQRRF
ncbi:MAG: hypothetical protein AB203_02515 [Parcubacteria bacterium C7867-008]|nr:MAG: hypothetical protein AB203_02515 [Parcubacteria bacterium C7867-008]